MHTQGRCVFAISPARLWRRRIAASQRTLRVAFLPVLERVVWRLRRDRNPTEVGELGNRCPAAEPPISTCLHPAERHLRFIVYGRPVDMTHAGIHSHCDIEGTIDVLTKHRSG